jgi:hypothetical protein
MPAGFFAFCGRTLNYEKYEGRTYVELVCSACEGSGRQRLALHDTG